MNHVLCVPDGCADEPVPALDGQTPLEAASTPVLDSLARRGEVGRAAVIPAGLPPGSDVGNMSLFGYDPVEFHTGRAPIEAAALGLELEEDQVAYRCNLVTVGDDGTMVDFAGGHPSSAESLPVLEALQAELGRDGIEFHPGVEYRHIMVAPDSLDEAECVPPHDLTDKPAVAPTGAAAPALWRIMEASRPIVSAFGLTANQIWLWGQGHQPRMPSFESRHSMKASLCSAVDLVRGLGTLTGMEVVEVDGMTAGYGTDYRAQCDAALRSLADGTDLFIVHVEATDEAGHAGDAEQKVLALERWDSEILSPLLDGLAQLGPWRLLLAPDHATPLRLKTHTADPVPYLIADSASRGPGGVYTERATEGIPAVAGHLLMGRLLNQD